MKYKVTIYDCPIGWVKQEETTKRTRLLELRKQAHENARKCAKNIGPDGTRNQHFVYYYEMPETFMGKKTGNIEVWVYMRPYMVDDATLDDFVKRCLPHYVGAIHGNNLCSKFFPVKGSPIMPERNSDYWEEQKAFFKKYE